MQPYDTDVEQHMRELYRSLSEKDRRRYAAVEAEKFGYGGTQYIAELFGCHPDTIRQGKADLQNLPEDAAEGRVRKKGAVAKKLALRNRELSKRYKARLKRKQQARQSKQAQSGPTSD
jgi:hypothetical protein